MGVMSNLVPTIELSDGNHIPQLGLGVWQAESGGEAARAVMTALETGYRHIDTAMVYLNEEDVGQAIKSGGVPREELFVTTKLWNSDQGAANVRPALEASLQRLGLDYVDLYLIHWPTPSRDLYVETWREFATLKSDGLAKSIGVSNFEIDHLERLEAETGIVPTVNQIEIHPGFAQQELRDYCKDKGIAVESWSPLGGVKSSVLDHNTIAEIANAHQKSPAQVVIRWHLQHGLIVFPKSVHPTRIRENFDVFDFELSGDDLAAIDAIQGNRVGPNPNDMNYAVGPKIVRAATTIKNIFKR